MLSLASSVETKSQSRKIIHDSFDKSKFAQLIESLSKKLLNARGKCLVVCGVNDKDLQILVNYINHLLGNYGSTLDLENYSRQLQGNDAKLTNLLEEIRNDKVSALFIYGVNPVYDLPERKSLIEGLKNIPLVVSFSDRNNETAGHSHYVCPDSHMLESWNDGEPVNGVFTLAQPVIQPLINTRSVIESLSIWTGKKQSSYDLIKNFWREFVLPRQTGEKDFQKFWLATQRVVSHKWDESLQKGFCEVQSRKTKQNSFSTKGVKISFERLRNSSIETSDDVEFNLILYPKISMLDGHHAHNPWLQELPDPISKIVWDNYASISPTAAANLNISEGEIVEIKSIDNGEKVNLQLPAHIQPGQHDKVISVALGYGRKGTDRFTKIGPQWIEARPTVEPGELVGKNVAQFIRFENGTRQFSGVKVSISKTGRKYLLASTQEHHELEVPKNLASHEHERRQIIQETSFNEYSQNPSAGSFEKYELHSLWPEEHTYKGHHWGMVIDLTACTGCSACVVSCQAENNIPVVGKDEVYRNREMHWIRIDRYYEEKDEEIKIAYQPMLCQQCDNAPCETVCPVLATVHSEEGLNQQVYNRCVGTRYCANNCPYKVRRFNWFEYSRGDNMQKLVLNPDVVVRERGIMEKCTFCVQRIQESKILAKSNGIKIKDGDIKPACQQSCPANAIVFGDMNDPESEVSKLMKDPRYYRVLEELGVRPSVGYLTLVRNREKEKGEITNG